MNTRKIIEVMEWLKDCRANPENYVVWIGDTGAAVLHCQKSYAHPVPLTVAHRFIARGLLENDIRKDGIAYTAG